MSKNRIIIGVALVLVLGILVWWFIGPRPVEPPKQVKSTTQSGTNQTSMATQQPVSESSRDQNEQPSVGIDLENPDNWWKAPISFYGRVVDEKDQPVPEAKALITWTDESPKGNSEREVFSDPQGFFSISGIRGKNLGVHVSKEGYYTSRIQRTYFEYAGTGPIFVPDPRNPFIFRLRKKGEMPPLVVYELEIPIKLGEKVRVNLADGNLDPKNGQLEIELLENVNGKRDEDNKWALRLSVVDGGILLSTDEYPFTAPETGYQVSLEVNLESKKPPTWNGMVGSEFFLRTKDGYGRIILKMIIGNSFFRLATFFNPTGSRNLESEHY